MVLACSYNGNVELKTLLRMGVYINMKKFSQNEFKNIIEDLLKTKEVQALKDIKHHNTSRFEHCLEVAYRGYVWASLLGFDYVSVARAGLLHDLFFYSTNDCDYTMREHLKIHPLIALENARKITNINDLEANIILSHMYLISNSERPIYPESKIICIADKYSSVQEKIQWLKLKQGFRNLFFSYAK